MTNPEDTLSHTARRIKPPDSSLRFILLITGVVLAGIGLSAEPQVLWLVAAGGIVVGYAFRPESDKYYMEGFSDGVEAGARLADERADARSDSAREGVSGMERRGATSGIDEDQRPAGDTDPLGRYPADATAGSRPARNPLTDDGRPIPASGPRAPAFPTTAALGTRSIDLRAQDGAETGPEVGAGVSEGEEPSLGSLDQ